MKLSVVKNAFIKTLPVMAGYLVLGIGFGILLQDAGYGVLWAFAMSLLITLVLTLLRGHLQGKKEVAE